VSYITYGALFLMAGPYALSRNGHVRGDVLYRFWRPRVQAATDLTLYFIFFLPAVLAFMYSGFGYAAMSVRFKEVSIFSPARVHVFPLKALIPIAGVLLLVQGIAEMIRCVLCIRSGKWPQRLRDVEETEALLVREKQALAERDAQAPSAHEGTGV